jgi:hypothetical protein
VCHGAYVPTPARAGAILMAMETISKAKKPRVADLCIISYLKKYNHHMVKPKTK